MSTTKSPGDRGAGAGLNLASPAPRPEDASMQKSSMASRTAALASYFVSGALCINLSQILGTPLYMINEQWYNAWVAFTKQSFGLLTMTLTQQFSPTKVIVSGDASVRGQLLRKTDGTLLLDFPHRLVLIANHQIYTDWLYLWWAAYCSGMHGRLHIVLKESLKKIPVIGWGMQLSQFIFLKRDWEKDRSHMAQALSRLNKITDPMWLLIFPEGTNLAPSTREKSAKWAAKNNMKDMRHCLLPRSTGLKFCLQELQGTVDYLYDCTIAYEGVPRGAFAQDIFTLKAGYMQGRPPKSVGMYWRRFALKDIPLNNDKAFELWMIARWREKDLLIENYLIHGQFPADTGVTRTATGQNKRGAGRMTVDIRSSHWYEFLQIFAPMGILAMVLYLFYGALPQKFFNSESGKAVKESVEDVRSLKRTAVKPTRPSSFSLDSLFDKDQQAKTFGNAGMALASWVKTPEAERMLSRADLVQQWLQDPQKLIVESLVGETDKENFMKSLKDEENRRKRLTNKHQGSFWHDMDDAESRASVRGSSKRPAGTFYQQLENAKAAKATPMPLSQKALRSKATFWDQMQQESSRRTGSVLTLPTLSSSASSTAINSMDTGSTFVGASTTASRKPPKLAKLGPKKLSSTASNVSKPQPAPSAVSKKPMFPINSTPNSNVTTNKGKATVPKQAHDSGVKSKSTTASAPTPKKAGPRAPVAGSDSTLVVKKDPPKLKPRAVPAP